MKLNLTKWAAAVALAGAIGFAPQAKAISILTTSASPYLGSILPDHPANPANEASYIGVMIGLGLGGSTILPIDPPPGPNGDITITRSLFAFGSLPTPTATGAAKDDTSPSNVIDLGDGWNYLLAKYGQDAYVWYVGGIGGEVQIPANLGQGGGLSHWSLYNPSEGHDDPKVPDAGGTAALLGLGIALLGLSGRKFRA